MSWLPSTALECKRNQGKIQLLRSGTPLLKEENAAKPAKRLRVAAAAGAVAAKKDPERNARSVLYPRPTPPFPRAHAAPFYGGAGKGHSNSWSEPLASPSRSPFCFSPFATFSLLASLAHLPTVARRPPYPPPFPRSHPARLPASRSPSYPCGKQRVKSRQVPPECRFYLRARA